MVTVTTPRPFLTDFTLSPPLKFVSRPIFFIFVVLSTGFIIFGRIFYARVFGKTFIRKVLIVGTGRKGRAVLEEIQKHRFAGYRVVGFIGDEDKIDALIDSVPVLGDYAHLDEVARKRKVDDIVVATEHEKNGGLTADLISCMQSGVEVEDMPVLYEKISGRIPY